MPSWKPFVALILCATICASLVAQTQAAQTQAAQTQAAKPASTHNAYWSRVFDENHVLQIELSVTSEQFRSMEPKRQGRESSYSYVKAGVTIDGEAFADAGLRFKGNSSYRFSQGTSKRPFKIDLNRFNEEHELHGATKLNLSTSALDPAFMKEKLGYELYRAAGMATPGVGWANVTLVLDGKKELLGLYVLVEQVGKKFIARNFGKQSKGSLLMKPDMGEWPYYGDKAEDNERYNIKSGGNDVAQVRQFAQLLQLIEKGTDKQFEEQIAERMDLPLFAGYLAATSLLASIDSYIGMPHNYYLMLDKADGKLRMLPWDLNETFGSFTMGQNLDDLVDWDIDRPWVGERKLVERLFATKQFPTTYRAVIQKLFEQEFTEAKLLARLRTFQEVLEPVLKANQQDAELADLRMGLDGDIAGRNAAVQRPVFAIRPFIKKRIASVQAQLSGKSDGKQLRGGRGRGPGGRPGRGRPRRR